MAVAVVTACAGAVELELTDAEVVPVIATWVNATGLARDDVSVWKARLTEACTDGVWVEDVAAEMAQRYVKEDLDLAMRGVEDGTNLRARAAEAVWLMARQVCPDWFPEGEIDDGPPGA